MDIVVDVYYLIILQIENRNECLRSLMRTKAKPKKKISTVIDDSYIGSTVDDFNRKYNTEVLEPLVVTGVLSSKKLEPVAFPLYL